MEFYSQTDGISEQNQNPHQEQNIKILWASA
jgi:hypothetical protein